VEISQNSKRGGGGTFGGEGEKVADGGRLGFLAGGVPRLTDGRAATRGAPAHQRRLGFREGGAHELSDRAGRQARGRRGTTEVPGSWMRAGG